MSANKIPTLAFVLNSFNFSHVDRRGNGAQTAFVTCLRSEVAEQLTNCRILSLTSWFFFLRWLWKTQLHKGIFFVHVCDLKFLATAER